MKVATVKMLPRIPVLDHVVLVNEGGVVKVEGDYHLGPEQVAGKSSWRTYSRHGTYS